MLYKKKQTHNSIYMKRSKILGTQVCERMCIYIAKTTLYLCFKYCKIYRSISNLLIDLTDTPMLKYLYTIHKYILCILVLIFNERVYNNNVQDG